MFLSLAGIFQLHHQNQSSLNSVHFLVLPLPVSSGEANQELAITQHLKSPDENEHRQSILASVSVCF